MSKQSYYIFSSGELKRRNDSLTLYVDGILKKDIPIERVKDLLSICLIIIIFMSARFVQKKF